MEQNTFDQQVRAKARHDAVMQYKMYIAAPAWKQLLEQCEHIETQLVIEESGALGMVRNLQQEIAARYHEQFQEDCE